MFFHFAKLRRIRAGQLENICYICRIFTIWLLFIIMRHPKSENILKNPSRSFSFRGDKVLYSDELGYHVHPEMELMAITDGGGKCIINEYTYDFENFDVVFMPGGIPHCWILDPMLCKSNGIVYDCCSQFPESFLHQVSSSITELKPMTDFYIGLRQAIRIKGNTARKIIREYHNFLNYSDGKQAIILVELLNSIYESGEYHLMGLPCPADAGISRSRMRFQIINKLITENYGRKITLSEAASAVKMNPTAFCNAFKATTGLTFNNYLTTYRLQTAARLLTTTMLNISEIAYKIGFGDFAHFTRTFTHYYGMSPTQYRKQQMKSD